MTEILISQYLDPKPRNNAASTEWVIGMIFKALFSISTAKKNSHKTQGYSYDASVPSSPPIKGQHPLLGNGPKSLSSKAIQAAKAQRNAERRITTSAGSTTESSTTYIADTPHIIHKIETRSTTSTSTKNWKQVYRRRSWEKDTRWSRPTTSTSFVSSTIQRPSTGYTPASLQKKLRYFGSLSNESNNIPRLCHVDLLDAHSLIHPSETLIRDRVQASGSRSYGEDVADRNMPPELPEVLVERTETPQESRPLIDSPELKFLKEIHLANKRAVGMTDNESTQASIPPSCRSEHEESHVSDNQVNKLAYPHSHPLRSLLSFSNEAYRPLKTSTVYDRTRSHSLSKLSQPKPQFGTFNDDAMPKNNLTLLKNLHSSVSSHSRVHSSPNTSEEHSTPISKESLDSQIKYQRSKRHTLSTTVSRQVSSPLDDRSFSCRQNIEHIPCSNSLATKRSNPSPTKTPLQNINKELNQNDFSKGVHENENRVDSKVNVENKTAFNKKENFKTDDTLERNDLDNFEPNLRNNGQRRCSLKQDSIKVPQRRQVLFINTIKLEPKENEVLSSNHSLDENGPRQDSPLPYLRNDIPQKSPDYSPAEAPTIRFDRNRSMDHDESLSFQEIHTKSGLTKFGQTKYESADFPVIAAAHERVILTENPKNSSQKPRSLPKNMNNEIIHPILPKKKDYMTNDASLGTQYVWHLRPLLGDNKICSKSLNTDRGDTKIRRLSLSQKKYNDISDIDEFYVSDQDSFSSNEDKLFSGEDNSGFDFANMLPGLQMMEPLPMT